MPPRSIVSTSTRLIREFGSQVAISVAASAVAAAFLAAPGLMKAPDEAANAGTSQRHEEPTAWLSPIAPDGKISIRYREVAAIDDIRPSSTLVTPATLAMPMSIAWPQSVFDETPVVSARVRTAEAHPAVASAAPLRKPQMPPERQRAAAETVPLPIVAARFTTRQETGSATTEAAPVQIAQATPSPLARVGNVMSGAVGTVGAAGIWTLSQASSLLPRL